jgi:hypothetical protein
LSKLQDKLLDAGVIPENAVKQAEQWQAVPEGTSKKIGEFSLEKIKDLKEELEIQRLPTLRESVLDLGKIMAEGRPVKLAHPPLSSPSVHAGVDRLGRYIFEIPHEEQEYNLLSTLLRPMTTLHDQALEPPRDRRMITTVSVIYQTIERQKQKHSVPTHWLCETEAQGEESILRGR